MPTEIHPPALENATDAHLPHPILLIVNGNSRTGQQVFGEAITALREAGVEVKEAVLAKDKAETKRLLQREIIDKSRLVIVGGGDGTLSSCAATLAGSEVAMGVIPLGTGNTFARSIGIPVDMKGAIETIAKGRIEAVDVGRCNRQIFLNSVSLGLSSDIAGALTSDVKKRFGLFAWFIVGGKVLARHRSMKLRVLSEERSFSVKTHQLMIANGRYVAGPIKASEDASLQDHQLTVFALGGSSKAALFQAVWHWLRHSHKEATEVPFFETKQLRVESLGRRLKANTDGEINEHTPLELSIWPRALRVVVPQDFVADEV
ncbi:lipid kinase, YegS/Rv2252/BmrU family [Abditibacterium utsteinense]|uniref:Lipid kinase, YegS/Rv2252/BmrU family n=1 Tax=Abditibacterium utsteinense TaxID=1960156 RepID=A0A2S8SW60_9BACT|nr:YegS/Rv2252/BmrU family lipid kinase [Abditibacterium utsteinense]PQV65035.1 lipid kinase, YegS/Rv2252/BmrU family [Abditibacterium utsteinense]